MSKPFDMELFLAGVLTGSHATRQRHLRQAKIIQSAIAERWQSKTPWSWKRKHLVWFIEHHLSKRSENTRYYHMLTIQLLARRAGKAWAFKTGREPSDSQYRQRKTLGYPKPSEPSVPPLCHEAMAKRSKFA